MDAIDLVAKYKNITLKEAKDLMTKEFMSEETKASQDHPYEYPGLRQRLRRDAGELSAFGCCTRLRPGP